MIRRRIKCAFILTIITLVLVLFIGQPHKLIQHFPSGLRNSVIHETKKFVIEDTSMSVHGDLELYVRMTSTVPLFINLYENILVRSMRYFWPDISSMVVVLDQEKPEDHVFGNLNQDTFPFPKICYMHDIAVPGYSGKDRMQRDMFYPERCTSKKYVAFVDTDTLFITRIIPEMLFADDKPIIIGIYGKEISPHWANSAHSTANLFKTKEVMKCMTYFPVVLKVDHIIHARQYIEKLHGMPFDEVFIKLKSKSFSQFNIMCQYIWLFHRNEYQFHLQLQVKETKLPSSYRVDALEINKNLSEEQRRPTVRVCNHYKKVDHWKTEEAYRDLFRSSICFAGGFDLCSEKCKAYDKKSLRKYMFSFSYHNWRWDNRCLEVQEEHYRRLARYANEEYSNVIRRGCHEVDTLRWSVN